jgi:hypothetical protein
MVGGKFLEDNCCNIAITLIDRWPIRGQTLATVVWVTAIACGPCNGAGFILAGTPPALATDQSPLAVC